MAHAQQHRALRGGNQAVDAFGAAGAVRHHLSQHRVVVGRDHHPGGQRGVHAHARRCLPGQHLAQLRQEVARRVLGAQAQLHRVPLPAHLVLSQRQRFALRNAQLPLDQIESGDQFGDTVLDLQAGIHLHEPEAPVRLEQELQRAGPAIADRTGGRDRNRAHRFAQCRIDRRRGRFFDQLLVAALHRTVALTQVDD